MLLSQSTSSGVIVLEEGNLVSTNLASDIPFAYPWWYNDDDGSGDCLLFVGVVVFATSVHEGGILHISDAVELTNLTFGLLEKLGKEI